MKDLESTLNKHAERRRKFLVKSGNAAAAAPALALLLQAGVKPAFAAGYANSDPGSDPSGPTATGSNPVTVTVTVPIITSTTDQVTSTTGQITSTTQG